MQDAVADQILGLLDGRGRLQIVPAGDQGPPRMAQRAADHRRIAQMPGAHGDVEAVASQVDPVVRGLDLQLDARMQRHELRKQRRQEVGAEIDRHGDANRAGHLLHRTVQRLGGRIELLHRRVRLLVIELAFFRQHRAGRRTLQQARRQRFLEPGDAAGNDRLGRLHPLRRAGETAGLGDQEEGAQVGEFKGIEVGCHVLRPVSPGRGRKTSLLQIPAYADL